MKKKVTSVVLDEDLLLKAKKEIPNLSGFFTDCLKIYLGYNIKIGTIQEELNKMKEAGLKVHLLTKIDEKELKHKNEGNKQINEIWRKIWRFARKTHQYDDNSIDDLMELTGKSSDEIIYVIEQCLLEPDLSDDRYENWEYVQGEYLDNDL